MKLSNKNHKGSALFTVVSVMMILMILVMGTFILVSAAHQKALNNYYNNQSYVTAKGVVDAFVKNSISSANTSGMAALRAELVGTLDGSGTMSGGIQYASPTGGDHGFIHTNLDSATGDYYADLTVNLPAGVSLGRLKNNSVRVYRLSRTEFKVTATVSSGGTPVYDELTGAIKKDADGNDIYEKETIRTVSEKIILKPKTDKGLFDSALITKGAGNDLSSGAQIYGGFVTVADTLPSSAFISANVRLVGNYYSNANITSNGAGAEIHIGYETIKDVFGTETKKEEYLETKKDFKPLGIKVFNVSSDSSIQPYVLVGGDMKMNDTGGHMGTFGSNASQPIDVYVKGDMDLGTRMNNPITIHGNVYCQGKLTMSQKVYNDITSEGFGVYTVTGKFDLVKTDGTKVVNGGACSVLTRIFPSGHVYKNEKYPDTDDFLKGDYDSDGDGTDDGIDYYNDSSALGGALASTATKIGGNNYFLDGSVTPFFRIDGSPPTGYTGESGDVNHWLLASGKTFTIKPDGSDVWIATPPKITLRGNTEIIIDNSANVYNPVTNEWLWNVYMYTPYGGNIEVNGAKVGYSVDTTLPYSEDGYNGYASQYHRYGSLDLPTGSTEHKEYPSNFFWAISSDSVTLSGCSFYGYVYGPGVTIEATSSPAALPVDSKYNNINMPSGYYSVPSSFTPTVIGSIIGNIATLNTTTGSVYVIPPNSIFNSSSATSLDDYDWTVSLYDNK